MKFLKSVLLSSILFLALISFTVSSNDYVGYWKGEDKGEVGFLKLTQDGYATFVMEDQSLGGKSTNYQGVDARMIYKIDDSFDPTHIDLVIIKNDNDQELNRLKGIIKMPDSDHLMMALGFNSPERPADFSKDAITFSRATE